MIDIMRISFLFLSVLFCLSLLPTAAHAQYAPAPEELFDDKPKEEPKEIQPEIPVIPEPADPNKKPLPFNSYDEIPQEALDDAHDFHNFCKNDPLFPTHYDCRCWEQRYLEERINLGPNVPRTRIMREINTDCLDLSAAAGHAYQKCQKYGISTYNGGMSPEEYCECVGNNYALLLENTEGFYYTGRKSGAFYSSATLRCQPTQPGVVNPFERLDQ